LFFSILNIAKENRGEFWLSIVATVCGVSAIVLSASRGSLVGLFLLLVAYGLIMLKSHNTKHLPSILLVALLSLGANLYFSNAMTKRVASVGAEIQNSNSSFGQRLDMYKAGWEAFKDSPFIGYGYHNCVAVAAKYASQDMKTQNNFKRHWHLHDETLTSSVNAGIMGFVSLWLLFLIPLSIFYKRYKHDAAARGGVILVLGYIVLGLSHTLFGYEYETAFFVVMLIYLLVGTLRGKHQNAAN